MSLYGINFTFGQSQLLTLAKLNYKAYEFSLKGMSKVPWKVSIRALSLQLAAVILICFVQESVLFGKQEVLSGVYSPASVSVCTQLFRQRGTRGFHHARHAAVHSFKILTACHWKWMTYGTA